MKFVIEVKTKEPDKYLPKPWREDYDKPEIKTAEEAEAWARKIIETFNANRQASEGEREFLSATITGESEIDLYDDDLEDELYDDDDDDFDDDDDY